MSQFFKKWIAWFTDHKRLVATVGVIVAVLFFAALYTLQDPLRNWPKTQPSQRTTYGNQSPQTEPALPNQSPVVTNQGDQATQPAAPFGYDDPRVAILSAAETQQLIFNVDCVVDLAQAHEQLLREYTIIYSLITNQRVQDALYQRIKNQQAFKYPELSIKWHEFSESGDYNPLKKSRSGYALFRAKEVRYRIVGAKITNGDKSWAPWAVEDLKADLLTIAGYTEKARLLLGWLIADQILSASVDPHISINGVADMQAGIDQIVRRNNIKPSGPGSGAIASNQQPTLPVPSLTQQEQSRLQVEADLTPAQRSALFTSLDRLAIYLTKDLRFTPILPVNVARNSPMPSSSSLIPRYAPPLVFPLLSTDHDRLQAFRDAWNQFRAVLEATHPQDAAELTEAYKKILALSESGNGSEIPILLKSMADRNITGAPITVSELNQVRAAEAWLDEALAKHEQNEQSMDAMLLRLRTHSVAEIRKVFMPIAISADSYTGGDRVSILDPFSREPTQPYQALSIQRANFNKAPPPTFASGPTATVRANDWTGAYVPALRLYPSFKFISRPTKKPAPPVDKAPMREIVRNQKANITADQLNAAHAALDRIALNVSPGIRFIKTLPSTSPSQDTASMPLLASQRDVLLMRRAACRQIAWDVLQAIASKSRDRATAEPDMTYFGERFYEILLAVMPYDDDDATRLKDQLADVHRRQLAGEPLTAGDLHDIEVWTAWLDAVSVEFRKQSELIDTVVARLRNHPLQDVKILATPYRVDSKVAPPDGKIWGIDPFSDHPLEPFLANVTEKFNFNYYKGEPIYFDVAALNLQIKMGGM